MSKIVLGKSQEGKIVEIDLKVLLRTRFLVQAASGGGKSQTLRRLAEQFFGKVPVWIIDREDEFPSLRDKFGYVFAGPGGETPIDPRSAELVCEKLLKAKASAIFGLYTLKDPARHEWVKLFLNALMNAPKNLWTHVIVMVDEAHKLCPEKGAGESVAREAMTDLAVDGRKRGFCAGYFTQRLGKLSKNASAELINRMIGKTVEDIDVDRAVELMSVRRAEREEFEYGIKRLKAGHFWSFGDAISVDRVLVHVGAIQTTHPEPGAPAMAVLPPLPEKMKALLPQLADLPKEAEQKAKTEAEIKKENQALRGQVATLERQLKVAPRPVELKVQTKTEIKEVPVLKEADLKRLERVSEKISRGQEEVAKASAIIAQDIRGIRSELGKPKLNFGVGPRTPDFKKLQDERIRESHDAFDRSMGRPSGKGARHSPPAFQKPPPKMEYGALPPVPEGESALLAGERKMLGVLAQFHPGSRTKSQLGALSGYTPSGGTFGQYFGKLKRLKLIKEGMSGELSITEAGLEWFGGEIPEGPRSPQELLDMWRGKLLQGERKMLDTLVQAYPTAMSKEDLGEQAGYTSSGGTFGQYLGTLKRNGLALVDGDNVIAAETLFAVTVN